LSAVSLVSRRFNSLVTTPHAWRTAFSRFFPGQEAALDIALEDRLNDTREDLRSERRYFTRLTALASWRSEYIMRTRLLRSLYRGKPARIASGHGGSSRSNGLGKNANPVVTYSSQLFATINHIHAVFNTGKKATRFIHGTDETGSATTSDPVVGKIDNWGLSDPQALPQFADLFVGDAPYGDSDGPVGLPNSMDVSQPFGMIYGEGFPGGQTYFRSSEEMRGRFLSQPSVLVDHQSGIPRIPDLTEAISAVWIARSTNFSLMTNGLVGMMTGSTLGIVTAYSLGAETPHGRRIPRGQLSAKWIICPGVPIISIKVDESYNTTRKSSGRIWAVALNALGEVFYLIQTPSYTPPEAGQTTEEGLMRRAWDAGRTAYWHLVEPSRRVGRDDPYHELDVHGSYSPRSSSISMNLSEAQTIAETIEIEGFLAKRPAHFRKICHNWDCRAQLQVDFAGDDTHGAGEGVFVIRCGLEEGESASIKRFSRCKFESASLLDYPLPKTPPMQPSLTTMASLFGGGKVITPARTASVFGESTLNASVKNSSPNRTPAALPGSPTFKAPSLTLVEEWRTSDLSLQSHSGVQITTNASDTSMWAVLTADEDPLLTLNGASNVSSPFATPSGQSIQSAEQIPGQRARILAVGTNTGAIICWNMRGPQAGNATMANSLRPLRVIQTDSPQVSCLAVSALYLVHGGNDGLVQTWDPLASSLDQPIKTLHSRFSSQARRRLQQAEASVQGVGINLYAAGAILLDPDPTVLRGIVSLGTHLRYWSYSASAADQYQSKKRLLRRGERGSNGGPDRFTNTGRGALMDYIATEQEELKREKVRRAREDARLRGRFGVGLGGLTDEEALRYAELISAETFQKDEERRINDAGYAADTNESSATITPEGSVRSRVISPPKYKDDEFDQDLEEAIRLSLLDGVDSGGRSPRTISSGDYDIPIIYKQKKTRRSASSSPSTSTASKQRIRPSASTNKAVEPDDLEFALQLSLAEEQSRLENEAEVDEFPDLPSPKVVVGKGKAKAS
jgi:hypothetical protein